MSSRSIAFGTLNGVLVACELGRRDRGPAGASALRVGARVRQLDARQSAVRVGSGDHDREAPRGRLRRGVAPRCRASRRSRPIRARTRCRRRPSRPRPSSPGATPVSRASPSRTRCSAAPGRSGSAASSGRSAPARRGCRGGDRGPWRKSRSLRPRGCTLSGRPVSGIVADDVQRVAQRSFGRPRPARACPPPSPLGDRATTYPCPCTRTQREKFVFRRS